MDSVVLVLFESKWVSFEKNVVIQSFIARSHALVRSIRLENLTLTLALRPHDASLIRFGLIAELQRSLDEKDRK